ncbi:HAD family hydrolase [Cytophaga aurantiaca]|uniref:HAD family hydrolase n=1 Tax=Cytophaga aurantiaca TaxID=29530 RepID=UPI00037DE823|nr:HAD family phosphatase [Cytophaga aurantiaca]
MNDFTSIKNIIFDLGAVIIPIDFEKTFQAFATLSSLPVEEIKRRYQSTSLFIDFEKGIIGNFTFLQKLRSLLEVNDTTSDQQLIDAWNTLLLPIPQERIDRIKLLASDYRLFLLSNTNPVHIKDVNRILYECTQVSALEQLFETTWYSYDLGLIKPSTEIYETVLQLKELKASETVFLDDNADNIAGALATGIHALHVTEEHHLLEQLKHA